MLQAIKARRESEEGFTLIELMVVVLIIAILLAIAIPTFLGARDRANDRAAQSSLRNGLTAAKTLYTDSQDYAAADTSAEMAAVEPSLTYGTANSSDFKTLAIGVGASADTVKSEWGAAVWSKTGTCFYIHEVSVKTAAITTVTQAGTYFGKLAAVSSATGCSAANALLATGATF